MGLVESFHGDPIKSFTIGTTYHIPRFRLDGFIGKFQDSWIAQHSEGIGAFPLTIIFKSCLHNFVHFRVIVLKPFIRREGVTVQVPNRFSY